MNKNIKISLPRSVLSCVGLLVVANSDVGGAGGTRAEWGSNEGSHLRVLRFSVQILHVPE